MSANGHTPTVAERMSASIEDSLERGGMGSRRSLYFSDTGRRLLEQYERDDGRGRTRPAGPPKNPAYVVEHPFRPSLASLADMVAEFEAVGGPVHYCEERWEIDPRVDEQIAAIAGGDPTIDWRLEHLMRKLEDREAIAA